jgi:hypothetical protein
MAETRVRVYTDDGRSFLLRKGKNIRQARSWAKAYHKHYGARHGQKMPMVKEVAVKRRVVRRGMSALPKLGKRLFKY